MEFQETCSIEISPKKVLLKVRKKTLKVLFNTNDFLQKDHLEGVGYRI